MLLLDCPPEIFAHIVHNLVSDVGACGSWQLRGVCKTFDAEIKYIVLEKHPKSILCSNNLHNCVRVRRSIATLQLFNQTQGARNADPVLPKKVSQMAQFVAQELKHGLIDKQKITRTICESINKHLGHGVVVKLLWCMKPDPNPPVGHFNVPGPMPSLIYRDLGDDGGVQERIVAAIAADAHDLVRSIISDLMLSDSTAISPVFGSPFHFARSLDNKTMLKTLLAMFSTLELGNRLQYDLLVHHILDSRINEAVAWAIFKREITILKVLVNAMNKGATTHPERKDFNKWLTAAIRTQSVDFVKTVLSVNINSRAKVSQGMFVTACNQGVPEIITALFGKNQIDPNKKFLECTPLILATRTGNLDVMKAVLDAGADINGSISEWPCNALEQAVHIRKAPSMEKREAAAKLLLSRGADVSATRSWPATKGLFNIFREAHLSRGAENVPTFEDYRSMEKARMMSFGEVIARLIL